MFADVVEGGGELDSAGLAPAAGVTWALTMTGVPSRSAAATASSTVKATSPGEMGMPYPAKNCLPWYSKRSTRVSRGREVRA